MCLRAFGAQSEVAPHLLDVDHGFHGKRQLHRMGVYPQSLSDRSNTRFAACKPKAS